MLSPSMRTISNGNLTRVATICRATSYSTRSPVPLSPITANLTASGFALAGSSCARNVPAPDASKTRVTIRRCTGASLVAGHRETWRLLADTFALGHLGQQSSNESVGHRRLIAAGAERVGPLARTEARQQIAGPLHLFRRDAPLDELLMPAAVIELDETILHAGDEGLPLEDVRVATFGLEPSG